MPLILLVVIGFILSRVLHVKNHDIGKLILYVLSPAITFKGFIEADLHENSIAMLPVVVFVLCCVISVIAHAIAKLLWQDGLERIAAFCAATGNTGFFGIPACTALIGQEALPIAVLVSFGITAYEISLGYYLVACTEETPRRAFIQMIRYPGLHAAYLGVFFNFLDISIPKFLFETVSLLAAGYTTLGMMIIGIGLAGLKTIKINVSFIAFTSIMKFAIWPIISIGFVKLDQYFWHIFETLEHKVLLIESLVPMAAVTIVHAYLRNIHPEQTAATIAISTFFSLIWLPIVLTWVV